MANLSPKDAALALRVTPSGLKYFELSGQLLPIRDSSGRRSYDPRAIARLVKRRAPRLALKEQMHTAG
jgi:DNA-binding transcriptional MerR regulator